jgi:lactoylglutathione lyase
MSDTQFPSRITNVRTVGVSVVDQVRALEFYVHTLGFEKRLDVPMGEGSRWIEVAPPGATTTIALVHSPQSSGGTATGIRLRSEDVEADHAALVSRGVDVDELLRWPGVPPMCAFRDQDKNSLVIIGSL